LFHSRLYTGKDADRKEIEDGFSVGPGQGLIVSKNAGGVLSVNLSLIFNFFSFSELNHAKRLC